MFVKIVSLKRILWVGIPIKHFYMLCLGLWSCLSQDLEWSCWRSSHAWNSITKHSRQVALAVKSNRIVEACIYYSHSWNGQQSSPLGLDSQIFGLKNEIEVRMYREPLILQVADARWCVIVEYWLHKIFLDITLSCKIYFVKMFMAYVNHEKYFDNKISIFMYNSYRLQLHT